MTKAGQIGLAAALVVLGGSAAYAIVHYRAEAAELRSMAEQAQLRLAHERGLAIEETASHRQLERRLTERDQALAALRGTLTERDRELTLTREALDALESAGLTPEHYLEGEGTVEGTLRIPAAEAFGDPDGMTIDEAEAVAGLNFRITSHETPVTVTAKTSILEAKTSGQTLVAQGETLVTVRDLDANVLLQSLVPWNEKTAYWEIDPPSVTRLEAQSSGLLFGAGMYDGSLAAAVGYHRSLRIPLPFTRRRVPLRMAAFGLVPVTGEDGYGAALLVGYDHVRD